MTVVIIPAHNETSVIGRMLEQLLSTARPGEFDVIVVANGCTDETAATAAAYGPPVRVLSIPEASKRTALLAGNHAAEGNFPRIYADADIEITADDVRMLAAAVDRPGVLAAGPHRELNVAGRPWLIRSYYEVWERLPEVDRGLFGRGVIALSETGYQRVAALPPLMADDLAVSLAFAPAERIIVPDARSVVHTPLTTRDLLRRRIRALTGVMQVDRVEGAPPSSARTRPTDLMAILRRNPAMAPKVAVFLGVALNAQFGASRAVRRGDYSTWLRDESSRSRAPSTPN